MLIPTCGLDPLELVALADLERRVLAVDGGRLKLEWESLRSRSGTQVQDLLWQDGGELVGFVGLYAFGSDLELTGMVDPAVRRRGIGGALLDAALRVAADRGLPRGLLVVPRPSVGGHALARSRGGTPAHSEYALVLTTAPAEGPQDPALSLRNAVAADAGPVARLLEVGFGRPAAPLLSDLPDGERTLVVESGGAVVATLRVTRDGAAGGVYGFVVDPERQGRGIGRDVLRRACQLLRAEGARQVGLEVEVGNDRALGLYTSLGFVPVTTEDYYTLACP